MNRREALRLGSWLAVGGALPSWLACRSTGSASGGSEGTKDAATSPSSPSADGWTSPLQRALDSARANGKPVLVFVAPNDPDERFALGSAIADALEFGGDDLAVELASCEVACATDEQLDEVLGSKRTRSTCGSIDDDGARRSWTPVRFEIAPQPSWRQPDEVLRDIAAHNDASVRSILAESSTMLAARDAAARRALPLEFVAELERRLVSHAEIELADLDRGAAIVRDHASFIERRAALAKAALQRIWDRAPHGARWMEADCGRRAIYLPEDDSGIRYELSIRQFGLDDRPTRPNGPHSRPVAPPNFESFSIACGIGFTNSLSSRFLFFYTDEP